MKKFAGALLFNNIRTRSEIESGGKGGLPYHHNSTPAPASTMRARVVLKFIGDLLVYQPEASARAALAYASGWFLSQAPEQHDDESEVKKQHRQTQTSAPQPEIFCRGIRRNRVVDARIAPQVLLTWQAIIAAQQPVDSLHEQFFLRRRYILAGEKSALTDDR